MAASIINTPLEGIENQSFSSNPAESPPSLSPHSSDENISTTEPQAYTFTPRRVRFTPRAWERKPATPFAPRNEAQKIWKRVPLQNVSTNVSGKWRKAAMSDGPGRPVKRLRLTEFKDDDDKENHDYVGVKWDSEISSTTSPRRKRQPELLMDGVFGQRDDVPRLYGPPREHSNQSPRHCGNPLTVGEAIIQREETTGDEESYDDDDDDDATVRKVSETVEVPDPTEAEIPIDPALSEQLLLQSGYHNPTSALPIDEAVHSTPLQIVEPDLSICFDITQTENGAGVTQRESLPLLQERADERSQMQLFTPEISPQPPTSLQIEDSEAAYLLASDDQRVKSVAGENEDDTAYLHEFLSRARAQKAARLYPVPENCSEPVVSPQRPLQLSPTTPPIPVEPVPSQVHDLPASMSDGAPDVESEMKASSPCRRSSRITPRLPRPHRPAVTVPSNIPLRRLDGTEFISMQRESQSLALATRSNTKKNRGEAIPVPLKLMQLHAGAWEEVSSESKRTRKTAKGVKWDEILARFRGDDGTEVPLSALRESEALGQLEAQEEKRPAKKVRRIRKASVGNVNGTPAPKRSVEMLVSYDERLPEVNEGDEAKPHPQRPRTRARH